MTPVGVDAPLAADIARVRVQALRPHAGFQGIPLDAVLLALVLRTDVQHFAELLRK